MDTAKTREVQTPKEFAEYITKDKAKRKRPYNLYYIENFIIPFDVSIPFDSKLYPFPNNKIPGILNFKNCEFRGNFRIRSSSENIVFENCDFAEAFNLQNTRFEKKARFRKCNFNGKTNFSNTVFKDLADFWRCTFEKNVIFYKTDFLATAVFSAASFKENVLFTYSLIDKLILFRGTKIEKGFDISTAIRSGEMGIFDFHVKDYKCLNKNLSEEAYERAISETAEIPIKNKRETFRILKQEHISQNNVVHSIEYKTLENETYLKENLSKLLRGESIVSCVSNLFVLSLNWLSSRFGVSYFQAAFFTLIFGGLFYYFTILSTSKYAMAVNFDWNIFYENIPTYSSYLLPTHRFDFLGEGFGEKYSFSNWFYFFDIFGRIVIGYGIYQTIQAFRKFR